MSAGKGSKSKDSASQLYQRSQQEPCCSKRRRDDGDGKDSPQNKKANFAQAIGTFDGVLQQRPFQSERMRSFEGAAGVAEGNVNATMPQCESLADSTHRLSLLEADNLESVQRFIALAQLASLTQTQSPLLSLYPNAGLPSSWPLIGVSHQSILGLRNADPYGHAVAYSSFNRLDPPYASMTFLQSNRASSIDGFSRNSTSAPCNLFNEIRKWPHESQYSERAQHAERASSIKAGNFNGDKNEACAHIKSSRQVHNSSSRSIPSRPGGGARHPCKRREKADEAFAGIILYQPEDCDMLNQYQIFLRQQIEIFRATDDDILSLTRGKNKPIMLQHVGLRCRHCSNIPAGGRNKGATYFPSNLIGIYQAAQNMCVEHFQAGRCSELPTSVQERFSKLASEKSVASGHGKKYWAESGRKLGLVDTDDGIRFAADLS